MNTTLEKIKTLAHRVNTIYDYHNIIRNEEFYKLVVKHDAEDFLLLREEIEENWSYFKRFHRVLATGLHPNDVRNLGGDYDF
jgi:hypothetical protein